METFALTTDMEVQKDNIKVDIGTCMALTVCRIVPTALPRTAPQHMYTKCRRVARPVHSSCVSTHRHNTNILGACRNAHREVLIPLCEVPGEVVTVVTAM